MVRPFPGHRDLYLLVAGILLGVVLGPATLGRLAPGTYERLFLGGVRPAAKLRAARKQLHGQIKTLRQTGVSPAAIQSHMRQSRARIKPVVEQLRLAQAQRRRTLRGWMTAIIIAALVVMGLESLIAPEPANHTTARVSPTLGRLVSVRYALAALWLALALARPTTLRNLPWGFTLLVLAVGLAAGLTPLGRSRRARRASQNGGETEGDSGGGNGGAPANKTHDASSSR